MSNSSDAEIEAELQVVWSVAFSLSMRFIVENVKEQQRLRLMDQAIELIMRSLEDSSVQ